MRNSISHCINGEPTGDDAPLYDDDDRARFRCPVCGYIRFADCCGECNGRRFEAMQAARRDAAPVHVLHPARRAA